MKDGFYLSTYLFINKLAHLTKIPLRHDQNLSLWRKEGNQIKLVHLWELERLTGFKQHDRAFFNVTQARQIINHLLDTYGLSMTDMEAIWGTPELQTDDDYRSLSDYPQVSYHSLCHLFSALLLDSRVFFEEDVIGLAADGAPDNVVDKSIEDKYYFCG
ncbi:MAG: hypothetical protein ACYCT0_05095, partial [Sulfobacillus sp.]